MARGKIVYTPMACRALVLPGDAYASGAWAAFNVGTGDLHLDALVRLDVAAPQRECWLAAKGDRDLAGKRGWHVFLDRDLKAAGLRINDGQANPTVYLSEAEAFSLGEWFWLGVGLDRDGDPYFRINGVLSGDGYLGFGEAGYGDYGFGGSAPPADYAGSLDNDFPLTVGGSSQGTNYFKGAVDFLRIGLGQLWPQIWYDREWQRLRYGLPPEAYGFLGFWGFEETLDDASGTYVLTWQGAGDPAYTDGWPYAAAPLTYQFEHNFEFGHSFGFLEELEFIERAADGTAWSWRQGHKQVFTLSFPYVTPDQTAFFLGLWRGGATFKFYEDADRPDYITGILASTPRPASVFPGMNGLEVEIQEV